MQYTTSRATLENKLAGPQNIKWLNTVPVYLLQVYRPWRNICPCAYKSVCARVHGSTVHSSPWGQGRAQWDSGVHVQMYDVLDWMDPQHFKKKPATERTVGYARQMECWQVCYLQCDEPEECAG